MASCRQEFNAVGSDRADFHIGSRVDGHQGAFVPEGDGCCTRFDNPILAHAKPGLEDTIPSQLGSAIFGFAGFRDHKGRSRGDVKGHHQQKRQCQAQKNNDGAIGFALPEGLGHALMLSFPWQNP